MNKFDVPVDPDDQTCCSDDLRYYIYDGGTVQAYDPEAYVPFLVPTKFADVFTTIIDAMDYKGSHYNTEPLDYVEPITILHQVRMKVERALQVKSPIKQKDDIKDLVVYSIRLFHRIIQAEQAREQLNSKVETNRVKNDEIYTNPSDRDA